MTIEEGSVGGFGSFVLHYLADQGVLDGGLKVRTMILPDIFQDHDSPEKMYDTAKLNAADIVERARQALGMESNVVNLRG